MRRHFILGSASLLLIPTDAQAQNVAAVDLDVASANAAFDTAVSSRDIARLEALCAQDGAVMAAHPRDRAAVVGWEAVRRSWQETFARFAELSVVMPAPRIRIAGDTAVVVGLENIGGRRAADGLSVAFDAMTTNVFERRAGRWLLVHHHATMVPV